MTGFCPVMWIFDAIHLESSLELEFWSTHTDPHAHTQRRVHARARAHTHRDVCMRVRARTHTHTHTHTHGGTHTHKVHTMWRTMQQKEMSTSGVRLGRQLQQGKVRVSHKTSWSSWARCMTDGYDDRGLEVLPAPISALFWSLHYCTGWSSLSLSLSFSEEPVTSSLAAHRATRTQPKCCAKLLVYWAKEPPKVVDGHTTESGCLNFFHNGQLPSQA